MGKRLGAFRATYLVVLCCIGSFLFAYDTGIVGTVLTLKSFQRDMGFTAATKTQISSNSASLLQAGGKYSSHTSEQTLTFRSILCLFPRMALHGSFRTPLVTCSSLAHL